MTSTPDPIDVAVGARLRLGREALGLSQADLAAALGLTFQQLQKYERATSRISASRLIRIARHLEVSAASLLGEEAPASASRRDLLRAPGAIQLLRAYNAIGSRDHRQALVAMARVLGSTDPA